MNPFGANWQTTLSGVGSAFFSLLTILAVAPYQLGDLATIIPPEYKAKVFGASFAAAFILRCWNSVQQKDRNVTGGTVQQTASGAKADEGTQSLVDATLIASKQSGETLTLEQEENIKQ